MASKKKKNGKNQVPLLAGFLAVVAVGALVFLWVIPTSGDKSTLSSDVDLAERTAEARVAELRSVETEETFAEKAAQAQIVDQFFPFFSPDIVSDPVAEINLLYPSKVERAVLAAGFIMPANGEAVPAGAETATVNFPASPEVSDVPEGTAAVKTQAVIEGDASSLDRFLDALRSEGILPTVGATTVSPMAVANGDDDVSTAGDLQKSTRRSYQIELLMWYTTSNPVDLSQANA